MSATRILRAMTFVLIVLAVALAIWVYWPKSSFRDAGLGTLLAVLGLVLAAAAWWRAERLRGSDMRRLAQSAVTAVAEALPAKLPSDVVRSSAPSALLMPERRVIQLKGRRNDIQALATWCFDPDAPRFCAITGEAQVGKTRLWMEFVERQDWGEWTLSRLRPGREVGAFAALSELSGPQFIVIETAIAGIGLTEFLRDVVHAPHLTSWKVLLVCRSRSALPRVPDVATDVALAAAPEVRLGPVGERDDHKRWKNEAVRAFANELGIASPVVGQTRESHSGEPIGVMLADWLATAMGLPSSHTDVFEELARAEIGHWRPYPTPDGDPLVPGASRARRAFALAWLVGAQDREDLGIALSAPAFETAEAASIALEHLLRSYPGSDSGLRLPADPIAAPIAVPELCSNSSQKFVVESVVSKDLIDRATIVGRLISVAPMFPEVDALLDAVLTATGASLDASTLAIVRRIGTLGRRQDRLIAHMIANHPPNFEESGDLEVRLGDAGLNLAAATAALNRVKIARAAARSDPGTFEPLLASSLHAYAMRLAVLKDSNAKAIEVSEQAVALHRTLTPANDPIHLRNLAVSLNGLSNHLASVGRTKEAVEASREAVSLSRSLVSTSEDFNSILAMNLLTLSLRLTKVDAGSPEAGSTINEAVDLYRQVVPRHPSERSHFQVALSVQAERYADVDQDVASAFDSARQALEVSRILVEENARETPRLVNALLLTGRIQWLLSRDGAQAIATISEGAQLAKMLAQADPDRHNQLFAGAVGLLAKQVAKVKPGTDQVVEWSRTSILLYRHLAKANPGGFAPTLAQALRNGSHHLADTGRHSAEATTMAKESVALTKALVANGRSEYTSDLAAALDSYALRLMEEAPPNALAIEVSAESVMIYRRLVNEGESRLGHDLAMALHNYSRCAAHKGRLRDALAASTEALAIEEASSIDGATKIETLRTIRRSIQGLLLALGQESDAERVRLGLPWPEER